MKADNVLNQFMDDDRTKLSIIQSMKQYARIQIEKDRERCADIALAYTMTLLPERRKAMERVIIDWPINLD